MKNDAGTRHLKEVIKNEEEQMVAHDVLKLELKRLRESLNAKADEVFGLQNRKFQLQMSMEERQQEVRVHTDVLKAQLKAAEEERTAAGKELSERLIRAERLNNKYEIICGRMGGDGGDDGEHTQAYYVIKAAQEREELQRQGDELDQQIQKSEREIRALEKTLSHLYSKNAGYKASYTPVETSSAQYEQKVLLEEQHRAALAKYRTQRMEQSELEDDLGRMQQQLAELDERRAGAEQHLKQAAEASAAAQEQVAQQGGRLERMRQQVDRLLADHRRASAAMPGVRTALELEVQLEDSLAKTKLFTSGLAQLARSDAADGQFALALEKMLGDAGIAPPADDDDDIDEGGEY